MSILKYHDLVTPFLQPKIAFHMEHVLRLKDSLVISPITVEIDLTDGFCNSKCGFCFFDSHQNKEKNILSKDLLFKLTEDLKNEGVKGIEFVGGGEPTLHPNFAQIVSHFSKLGFSLGLVTNGIEFDNVIPVINKFSFIRISIDASTTETYRAIHGVDKFYDVINNINKIDLKFRDRIGIGYLIVPENIYEIIPAAKFFSELGVRFIQFRPASLKDNPLAKHVKDIRDQIDTAKSNYKESCFQVFDAGVKWNNIQSGRMYQKCSTSTLVAVIKANGDIPLCVLNRNNNEKIIGNLYKSSFRDIWYSSRHGELIKQIDIHKCRIPCKHDSYNIAVEAMERDYFHKDFV